MRNPLLQEANTKPIYNLAVFLGQEFRHNFTGAPAQYLTSL